MFATAGQREPLDRPTRRRGASPQTVGEESQGSQLLWLPKAACPLDTWRRSGEGRDGHVHLGPVCALGTLAAPLVDTILGSMSFSNAVFPPIK